MNINPKVKTNITDFLQSITIALGISVFIFFFVVSPSIVEGQSMEPNFYTGERLYTDRLPHWFNGTFVGDLLNLNYKRGDIVVVEKPGMERLIKRIIGLPGEKIELKQGRFYINDVRLSEDYIASDISTNSGSFLTENISKEIPADYYFVAGDNRSVSNDSRFFGFIKTEWLVGKPFVRVWPFDRIRTF